MVRSNFSLTLEHSTINERLKREIYRTKNVRVI